MSNCHIVQLSYCQMVQKPKSKLSECLSIHLFDLFFWLSSSLNWKYPYAQMLIVWLFCCPMVWLFDCPTVLLSKCLSVWLSYYLNVQWFYCPIVQISKFVWLSYFCIVNLIDCPTVWMFNCPKVQMFNCPIIQLSKLSECESIQKPKFSDCWSVQLSSCPIFHLPDIQSV
jgi:hypothetical protein